MTEGYDFAAGIESLKMNCWYQELHSVEWRFNLFDALGITHRERPHSYLLRWLLEHRDFTAFRNDLFAFVANCARQLGASKLVHRLLRHCAANSAFLPTEKQRSTSTTR